MKNNQPITQREHVLQDGDRLVSTTDLKGIITDVNDAFVRVSGFSRTELIGSSHNIVRHPDMPPAAFADLWANLRQAKPWMGLVKNRCKNGDHYYVDAHVIPIFEGDRVVGYQSVRVAPDRAAVRRAETLYAQLRRGRTNTLGKLLPENVAYTYKAGIVAAVTTVPAFIAALSNGSWFIAGLTLLVAAVLTQLLIRPLVRAVAVHKDDAQNELTCLIYSGRSDEVGQLEAQLQAQKALSRTILGRISYAAGALNQVAGEASDIVERTTAGVLQQQLEVDQVATAMNEMAATVNEVARNAEETARASQDVLGRTEDGAKLVAGAIADIEALSLAVEDATRVIERLQAESQGIGSVVDVISNIASETNLLALNAAIEAARAGDQGRGFAVVADEVRNLASHTQKSTDEILQMVKSIQHSSAAAVDVMQAGQQRAAASVELSRRVGQSFQDISAAVDRITSMNAQIATASEEQTAVTEEINRNLTGITGVASDTLVNANQTAAASQRLHKLVDDLQSMLKQFGLH